jgi:valyl-tRNA synthetase
MNLKLSPEDFEKGLGPLTLDDEWILSVLNRTIEEMNTHLEGYHFDRAAMRSYTFFWDEFCAYYVEMAKPTLFGKGGDTINKQRVLTIVLLASIRLMHPIAPFITEEIFQKLKEHFPHLKESKADPHTAEAIKALRSPACITAPYPKDIDKKAINLDIEKSFAFLNEIVYAIRNIRAEMQLPPSAATDVILEGETQDVEPHSAIISSLVRINTLSFNPAEKPSGFTSSALVKKIKITIPLPRELIEKEKERLKKEQEKLKGQITSLEKQLANPNFVERAPSELVEKTKASLKEIQEKLSASETKYSEL